MSDYLGLDVVNTELQFTEEDCITSKYRTVTTCFNSVKHYKFIWPKSSSVVFSLDDVYSIAWYLELANTDRERAIDEMKSFTGGVLNSEEISKLAIRAGSIFWHYHFTHSLFIKMKKNVVLASTLKEMIVRRKAGSHSSSDAILRLQYAHSSVLNEFAVAPEVFKIISENTLQKRASELDLPEVRVICPVASVVLSGTPVKFMIYPFVLKDCSVVLDKFRLSLFCAYLEARLRKVGVVAGDLNPSQFFMGQDGFLYLVDLEGYYKMRGGM